MKRIGIFASGAGTNAENIINYFQDKPKIAVVKMLTNNKDAKVIEKSKRLKISYIIFDKLSFIHNDGLIALLKAEVDFIVLAGFLWKIPNELIEAFHNKIINIHPALLPKYGGKGMYGMHVHEAVVANKEKESGITIHYVNENYDEGAIIFQKSVRIDDNDTPKDVAEKIHQLEYEYFPQIIEEVIKNNE